LGALCVFEILPDRDCLDKRLSARAGISSEEAVLPRFPRNLPEKDCHNFQNTSTISHNSIEQSSSICQQKGKVVQIHKKKDVNTNQVKINKLFTK